MKERKTTMKILVTILLLAAPLVLVGCDRGIPGGPGASNPANGKPVVGQADETFTLSVPTMSTSIKQGETKTVTIAIKRGRNFDEDVALKFTDIPKGLTLDPVAPTIKHGDTEAKINLKAANDAALGDFTIQVSGHPTKGPDASNNFRVTIK
jgi:hypothetical protein